MKKSYIILMVLFFAGMYSCREQKVEVRFDTVQNYVATQLKESVDYLNELKVADTQEQKIEAFRNARLAFKKAEPFSAYLAPESAHRVNGPPLPIFREDNGKVLPPIGLQAIEETIYGDEGDSIVFIGQIEITKGYLDHLIKTTNQFGINPKRYFLSIHQQLLRIFSLGLTGFDTPTSLFGLDESVTSLQAVKEVYSISISDTIKLLNPTLDADFKTNLDKAANYIADNKDFETFNRYQFGREYLNPLTKNWVDIRKTFGYEDPKHQAINLDAETFFEKNSFNLDFFRSSSNRNPSDKQIRLGEKLFGEMKLSASGDLSCKSCHNPQKAYQDGLRKAIGKDGQELDRNAPTIINTVLQKKFFWDGRSDNLEQQITNVFETENEFDNDAHKIKASSVLNDEAYRQLFNEAYPNRKIGRKLVIKALSSYTSTLNAMNSRFDKNMRGELDDFTDQEILGMNLYMGKALCSTCHFVPLTNGTVPPLFNETEKEILGVPKTAENKEIDPDKGFYWVFEQEIHEFMFKTPTVRNAALTAPYMHNGVYETLEQVVDFYNQGGGGGMGFDLPHQTLPFDSLSLSSEEQEALVAFMETLTDTEVNVSY